MIGVFEAAQAGTHMSRCDMKLPHKGGHDLSFGFQFDSKDL